jgi:hypothetical protein
MPAYYQLRGNLLILAVVGVTENAEIERALMEGVSSAQPGVRLRLLWDARRAVTLLSSDDVAFRLGIVASLASRGIVIRAALLVDPTSQQAMLDIFLREIPRALSPLPAAVFQDEAEALNWLGASD